jgi:predicted RNA-binding Zn-ribbon protein involved in translation (DUF1610 family)
MGLLPDSCDQCGVPFPNGSGRDHFTCPSCGKVNGRYVIGPRKTSTISRIHTVFDDVVDAWWDENVTNYQEQDVTQAEARLALLQSLAKENQYIQADVLRRVKGL